MKSIVLFFTLLFAASTFAQTNFNVWTPKGNVITGAAIGNQQVVYATSGCVVVASPCFRMWYGTYTTGNLNLLESLDGLTSWTAYSGNPVQTGVYFPTLFQVAGTYYLFASPSPGGTPTAIAEWTSTTGLAGSWTSIGTVLTAGSAGAWDSTEIAQLNLCDIVGGIWYAYYSGSKSTAFAGGLATSLNGTSWTKYASNPLITGLNGSSTAQYTFTKTGTTYYAYGTGHYNNAQLGPSPGTSFNSIFRWSSASVLGPWSQLSYNGNQTATYYAATAADFVSLAINNQLGDPSIVVAQGNIYLYFDVGTSGSEGAINEAEAIGVDPVQLASGYEGVVGVPISGAPQLNLSTSGSDPGTGANANPIGGSWTTNPFYHAIQRNSNLIESGQTTAGQLAGIAYWNAATWANDQWSQLTAAVSASSSTALAVALRENTGVKSLYYLDWSGALGNSGTSLITQIVSGTATNLSGAPSGLTLSLGDTILGVINGTSVYYYYDNILIGVATGSGPTSGAAGIYIQGDSISTSDAAASAWSGGGLQNAPALTNATQIGGFLVSKNWRDLIPLQVAP